MSYFREANRPKRRYEDSADEAGSGSDDDETEDDEPWNQGRRRKPLQEHPLVQSVDIQDIDNLTYGNRSWLSLPSGLSNGLGSASKLRNESSTRRYFFHKDPGPVSPVDEEADLSQDEEDDIDEDEGDDPLEPVVNNALEMGSN